MIDKEKSIFELLDMNTENGLATDESLLSMSGFQKIFYKQVKDKLNINAVYFLRDEEGVSKIPLIYFSFVDEYNPEKIAELHRLAWNLGEAPLLFVVTPTEIKIYNNYITPKKKDGSLDPIAGLIDNISLVTELEQQKEKLFSYNRKSLESGDYWRHSRERFDINTKIDTTLMNNLRIMRRKLIESISSREENIEISSQKVISIVHGLLSRSILITYLEERKDSFGKSVFPQDFYKQFNNHNENYTRYTDILSNKEATYKLFEILEKKFNGDMLPLVNNEKDIIRTDDLLQLQSFLKGDSNLENNQLALWPLYDFNIIPIQIISNIYELFFHLSDIDDKKGTYYTPLHLVDTLLDEVYPWEGEYTPVKVIDPACGSGIFLVEIYRRIVWRWMQTNNVSQITNSDLTSLLNDSIYGVDLNEEAIRVASFSLSLAMCDFLDPRSIWNELVLPKLVNKNLIVSDFFDKNLSLGNNEFNIVIGNPPWESKTTRATDEYLKINNEIIGDRQIAQAFAIKCRELCKNEGKICLLMPSKGFLFNRSKKNRIFRERFFANNAVFAIINFSIYRHSLFANACAPSTAIIYSPNKHNQNNIIYYCTPKPDYSIQDARKFSIDPTDICKIPQDIVSDDRIWKIAMWGSPRDLELIDRLQRSYPSLEKFLKDNEMISGEGFIRGNVVDAKTYDQLLEFPIINVKNLEAFYTPKESLLPNINNLFLRPRLEKFNIYKGPHLIMKQSHSKGRFFATVLNYDAIFNHSLLGISGNEKILKYLCLIVNSTLFTYYHLLTSRTWMVERDALEAGDIRNIPIPVPTDNILKQAEDIFDYIVKNNNEQKVNDFVAQLYSLKPYEQSLLNDGIQYIYNYFDRKHCSHALMVPSQKIYNDYFLALKDVLKNSLGDNVINQSAFFVGKAPLSVLALYINQESTKDLEFVQDNNKLDMLLDKLDETLIEKKQSIYIRRNVRIYTNDAIYIVKPKQEKSWNFTSACRDADEIFADVADALYRRK